MHVQIRIASEVDIPEMHRIRTSVRENRLQNPAKVQPGDYRPRISDRGRGWVAEIDGQMAGFAVADQREANIWALFVDPGFEGRGIGRALHDTMMDWLFTTGTEQVWLTTGLGTRAERFYKAAGWRYVGLQDGEARYELSRQDWLTRSRGLPRT